MKITKLEDMYPYVYIIRHWGRLYLWTSDGKLIKYKDYLKEAK